MLGLVLLPRTKRGQNQKWIDFSIHAVRALCGFAKHASKKTNGDADDVCWINQRGGIVAFVGSAAPDPALVPS